MEARAYSEDDEKTMKKIKDKLKSKEFSSVNTTNIGEGYIEGYRDGNSTGVLDAIQTDELKLEDMSN